jgi:hypothetical protein
LPQVHERQTICGQTFDIACRHALSNANTSKRTYRVMTMPPFETSDFEGLLTAAASWLLLACASWAVLIGAAAGLEAVTRGRLRATTWVCCPASVRQALLVGVGVALVGVPGTATASTPWTRPADGQGGAAKSAQLSLPVPARPLGSAGRGPAREVVQPGDTLWHLAQTHLRTAASPALVADLVSRVHQRNRQVIGPDPDLIRPGQRLVFPATSRTQDTHRPAPTPRGEP